MKVSLIGYSKNDNNLALMEGLEKKGHEYADISPFQGLSRAAAIKKGPDSQLLFTLWVAAAFLVENVQLIYEILKHRKDIRGSDLLFVKHHAETAFPVTKLASKLTKTPLIYPSHMSLHHSIVQNNQKFDEGSIVARILQKLDGILHRNSDQVLVFSSPLREDLAETHSIQEERYEVVYVTFPEGSLEGQDIEKDLDVVYWGTFMPYHALETVVDAAAELPDVNFTFLGDGALREEMMERAEEKGLENVDFKGFVEDDEFEEYLNRAKIAVGTFSDTRFNDLNVGTKIVQAAYLRIPAVTADSRGVKDAFTDGESVMMSEPEDPEELRENIDELMDSDGMREEVGKNAQEVYNEYFTSERHVEKLERINSEISG